MPQRGAHVLQGRIVERGLRVDGGVAGREQKLVALPERQPHRLAQPYDYAPAGTGTAVLDEAEVALRGARAEGEVELAEVVTAPRRAQGLGKSTSSVCRADPTAPACPGAGGTGGKTGPGGPSCHGRITSALAALADHR
nr:hypothetical protein GCM10020093_076540 [Planobispora longispora]